MNKLFIYFLYFIAGHDLPCNRQWDKLWGEQYCKPMEISFANLWKYHLQTYGNIICKPMEISFANLWKYHLQTYVNIICKPMEISFANLWKYHLQTYGNIICKPMEISFANLWKYHFSAIANSVGSTDNRDQVMTALRSVSGHNYVISGIVLVCPQRQGGCIASWSCRVDFGLRLHRFKLCRRRLYRSTVHEGWGCDQLIGSTVSDVIVRCWLWSTATRSSIFGYFSGLLQVVDNWPHIQWY